MPKSTPKKRQKERLKDGMVQKKRRNLKKTGYMREMNQGCCHMKLREGRIEDIDWWNVRIVSFGDSFIPVYFGGYLELGSGMDLVFKL